MADKAYELIVMVIKYAQINFYGGNETIDWDTYRERDKELYDRIRTKIEELGKGEKK